SLKAAWWPRPRYHLLADAIYWSDELPQCLPWLAENALRLVIRYRTSLVLGKPDVRCDRFWREALKQFPRWIGFRRSRTTESKKLRKLMAVFHETYLQPTLQQMRRPICKD